MDSFTKESVPEDNSEVAEKPKEITHKLSAAMIESDSLTSNTSMESEYSDQIYNSTAKNIAHIWPMISEPGKKQTEEKSERTAPTENTDPSPADERTPILQYGTIYTRSSGLRTTANEEEDDSDEEEVNTAAAFDEISLGSHRHKSSILYRDRNSTNATHGVNDYIASVDSDLFKSTKQKRTPRKDSSTSDEDDLATGGTILRQGLLRSVDHQHRRDKARDQTKATILVIISYALIWTANSVSVYQLYRISRYFDLNDDVVQQFYAAAAIVPAVFGGALADGFVGNYSVILSCFITLLVGHSVINVVVFIPDTHLDSEGKVLAAVIAVGVCAVAHGTQRGVLLSFAAAQCGRMQNKQRAAIYWIQFGYAAGDLLVLITMDLQLHLSKEAWNSSSLVLGLNMLPALVFILVSLIIIICGKDIFLAKHIKDKSFIQLMKSVLTRYLTRESIERSGQTMTVTELEQLLKRREEQREKIKVVFKILVLLANIVLFPLTAQQAEESFYWQASCMTHVGNWSIDQPLNLYSYVWDVVMLTMVPFLVLKVFPRLRQNGKGHYPLFRLGLAGLFLAMSVGSALLLERYRALACVVSISVLYQIPQWLFLSLGQLFGIVTAMEIACLEAPKGVRGLLLGLGWTSFGLATMLGTKFDNFVFSLFPGTPCHINGINCRNFTDVFLGLFIVLAVNFIFLGAAAYIWKQPLPKRRRPHK
ncbi:uncharacterized protein LOC106159399 [Lingula anatina]|uniref:Uncharacterized protein LOC106159399 n=1 Tax=Lingula anatina TaxID=7574 RepID=A0A1S3HYN3_LINAN|nr:uncharacterized protein LOC106159399 [Lingula anatina]|eukprot:XP_013391132.1 uncharacterized protein LOC106159399 [Lingula anatina]